MNDPISKALDIEPMKNEVKPKEKTEVQPIKDNKVEQDFEFARIIFFMNRRTLKLPERAFAF